MRNQELWKKVPIYFYYLSISKHKDAKDDALKDSERTNFVEHIQNAIDNGLTFTIIVDESHQNDR